MSLMKRRTMTDKQKAAARANGRRSQGPTTREGRENIRDSNLRHGLYSQAEQVVLESLGEDPERFKRLHKGLYDSFQLAPDSPRALVDELMAAIWRLERIERRQEELDIQRAEAITEQGGPLDLSSEFNPILDSRLQSMEEVTSREIFRIGSQLLEIEAGERERPLTGLPEKVLKTKGERIRTDEDFNGHPEGSTFPPGIRESKETDLTLRNGTRERKTSYAGITPESIENKG
jgi:hypothetical protein